MNKEKYVIGLDFGTDSVRALIVNVTNGKEKSSHVSYYKRWSEGKYSDPSKNQFRHHPLDYLESLEEAIKNSLGEMPSGSGKSVIGIGIDTTGSTPAPVDREGVILALKPNFTDNPNAMFILWKDHTAINEAEHINKVAKSWGGIDFTKYEGGVYSSEWFWSKILHVLREDDEIRNAAFSWVELADWIPAILTGNLDPLKMKRSRCAAGHKAMWHEEWRGLPSEEFLIKVDSLLRGLRDRLYKDTFTSDIAAGFLIKEWADRLGLPEGIAVTVGAFDPHMGAVGADIKDKVFVKVLGTSCCDMAVGPKGISEKLIDGICGQVDGSIIPGMIGYEAGQSSFGDVYAWFKDIIFWPIARLLPLSKLINAEMKEKLSEEISSQIIRKIETDAERLNPGETGLIALDWLNGRRTPFADQRLKGAVIGLNLGTDAVRMYKAFVEATAFGSKAIIEKFKEDGVVIDEVVAIGGIPQKSPLVMQVLADVLNMPVKVTKSTQAVALGASIFAATASGYYKDVYSAQKNMSSDFIKIYNPKKENVESYKKLYIRYKELGNSLEDHLRRLSNS
jgi:L-ribulokinase